MTPAGTPGLRNLPWAPHGVAGITKGFPPGSPFALPANRVRFACYFGGGVNTAVV